MMADEKNTPEFPTEDHRTNHIAALKREADGYKAKAAGADATGDEAAAKLNNNRAEQVANELTRLGDSARPNRGATRSQ